MKKWDVTIIGSGISALTCAALLSKKGKSVCVLEQYNKAGGYMHCFSRFGERFDTGAHYMGALGRGQPFHTLLSYLGVYQEDLFVELDRDGFDVFHLPDMEISFPAGYEAIIDRLSSIFPEERSAIQTYFKTVYEVAQNFPTYQFTDEVDMSTALRSLETPLSSFVRKLTSNETLQFVLYSYCALHGVEPEDVSLGMHSIVTDSLLQGAYGLAQGGDALTKKFVDLIRANGGAVLTKKRVVQIETTHGIAHAVITADGEKIESDWIISSIHPKKTLEIVDHPEIFTTAFRERMASLKETIGLFGIYAKCENKMDLSPRKNYYFFSTKNPRELLAPKDPSVCPNSVFLSPSCRAPDAAKTTFTANIHAAGPMEWFSPWRDSRYGKRPEEYENFKTSYAEQIFGLIERTRPGFRTNVRQFATSTPVTNLHFNGTEDGSPYGIYHSIQNTGARAIGPRTKIPNLLLTGQNCLFPGLLGAAIAALRTSGHIIGIKPVLRELKEMGQEV